MNKRYKRLLEKQNYKFCGKHSAVKICAWTKKSLRGEAVCYKERFYGIIQSHRCCQMSPSINFCNMHCIFCWRERNNSSFGKADNPAAIIDNAIAAQRKLLSGFGGNKKVNREKLGEGLNPRHFAISLSGEPTTYSKLNKLIKKLHERGMTTFVVTNGQLPERIEKLEAPTQLYISLTAPDRKTFERLNRPDLKDGWARLMKSLGILKRFRARTRTAIRITLVKGYNMHSPERYARLIKKAMPQFLEIKAYMFVGASRQRLNIENMPLHSEIERFAKRIGRCCGYKITDESQASRVVLLRAKQKGL